MVENIKLVFVPRNGFKRVASVECAYWFPRSGERHLLLRGVVLTDAGLKDTEGTHNDTDVWRLASV